MKKTIFLTGSKGFIGKHLLPKLTDYAVHCGGRDEVPHWIPDYVIHLAGTTTTLDSFIPELWHNNITYAEQIMKIRTRIIYASSTSASELSNPYAYTKAYLEYLGSKVHATGLRFFNVYGPGNNKGIIKRCIDCGHNMEDLNLVGGSQIRDFIYIDDVVKAIIDNLDSDRKLIDIGTGIGTSIYDAMALVESVFKVHINYNSKPPLKTDMRYSVASLGIPGCLSLREGLFRMKNQIEL